MGVPLTVMVLPATKLAANEFVPGALDNCVVPVTGDGIWLLTTLPVTVVFAFAFAPVGKPSAVSAAVLELVTVRGLAPACNVIAPLLMDEAVEGSVIESIFVSSVPTLSVTLSSLPVAPEGTNVICV